MSISVFNLVCFRQLPASNHAMLRYLNSSFKLGQSGRYFSTLFAPTQSHVSACRAPVLGKAAQQEPCTPTPLQSNTPIATQTRSKRIYYKANPWKRVNKFCIEKRLRSPDGVAQLWRAHLKDRVALTPFDRILPDYIDGKRVNFNGKILPEHHIKYNQQLINKDITKLFDPFAKKAFGPHNKKQQPSKHR